MAPDMATPAACLAQRSSGVKTACAGPASEACFYFFAEEKEKTHPARWEVQPLATDLLELVLLLRSRPAVRSHQGRGEGIPQIRIAGGCRGKVCSRRAGGALEGSGWWLLVPVSWVNF